MHTHAHSMNSEFIESSSSRILYNETLLLIRVDALPLCVLTDYFCFLLFVCIVRVHKQKSDIAIVQYLDGKLSSHHHYYSETY